ncbi:MAG: malate synthase G, partial [Rhizobiales bacterium]|nr:malate synthase G [Hyphomicrobiales bacterium]
MTFINKNGLNVAIPLVKFINEQCLPSTGISSDQFWNGCAKIFNEFSPKNQELLNIRLELQAAIDAWHKANPNGQQETYIEFLREIDYLVEEPDAFTISTENTDPEIANMAGPQLVVPVLNARFALNAANARWGSLYDALYGTDILETKPKAGEYDAKHGANVIEWAKNLLDQSIPLANGSHNEVLQYSVIDGALSPA